MSETINTVPVPMTEELAESPSTTFTPINGNDSGGSSPKPEATKEVPATPKKNKAKPKAATPRSTPKPKATPAKRANDGDGETPKSGNKRAKPDTPAADRKGIPSSRDALSVEDKMMLDWKQVCHPFGRILNLS